MSRLSAPELNALRQRVRALDGTVHSGGVVALGLSLIDDHLPGGGLARGAVHELSGSGRGVVDAAAATLFAAGIAARCGGPVIWVGTQPDLFAPGLIQAGLDPDRLVQVDVKDDAGVLACCEEALRHTGVGAVVAEVAQFSLTASRRLQLSAEKTHALCLIVRRWKREKEAVTFGQPTAAHTRWRVASLPSAPLAMPGIGRARWRLDLLRCKGADSACFEVEAFDDKACLAMATPLVNRPTLSSDRTGWRNAS